MCFTNVQAMEIKLVSFIFFLCLNLSYVSPATDAEKLCILEKKMDVLEPVGMKEKLMLGDLDRIAALEKRMEALELLCIARSPTPTPAHSGMDRNCAVPSVLNGEAHCPEKLPPGSKCSVVCNPGYIATPSKHTAMCKKDGFWTLDMECEIPLVIISGGLTDQSKNGDSSVEVLSLYPSKGCDRQIPDMPLADGSHRTLHNLIYLPQNKRTNETILACNGLTNKHKGKKSSDKPKYRGSCDVWALKTNTWKHHSYPDQGSNFDASYCRDGGQGSACNRNHPNREKGRYASELVNFGGHTYILGGMVYDDSGHEPTKSGRSLSRDGYGYNRDEYWYKSEVMDRRRAFFCAAKVKESGALMMGGLGKNKNGTVVEKSVHFLSYLGWTNGGLSKLSKVRDMTVPRSGHGCTAIPGDEFSVLVTGGTQGFGQAALADAELFSWNSNSWTNVTSMSVGRFGHAVVALGERVFAIGGDDRNQNNMDTIEEYDVRRNTWNIIKQKLKKPRSNFGFTLVPHSIFDGCTITS